MQPRLEGSRAHWLGAKPRAQRPNCIRAANQKREETEHEDRVAERSSEVLPEWRPGSRIVGRKQQRQHEENPEDTCQAHLNTQHQTKTNRELSVSDEKCDGRGVRQHQAAQHGYRERVGTVYQKAVDPELKAAVQRELRAKY